MPSVSVQYGLPSPTHDISLSDGSTTYGLVFAKGGTRVLQEIPLSPPAQVFEIEQKNWIGGQGRRRYDDDPTGFFDSDFLWSMTEGRIFPTPQWRFASSLRSNDTSLPGNNSSFAWWKLYGNTPGSRIARYLSIAFVASSSYSADRAWFHIRRRGTPGTLTVELCADNAGSPGTVLKTATQTGGTKNVSMYRKFNWSGTESLTNGTTYHLKIYGDSSDDSTNYYEILGNSAGTSSKYSAAGSSWTSATISMFYRVTDEETNRQWRFFTLEGALYVVDSKDNVGNSALRLNGARGTATAGTASTLTNTNVTMVTNAHAGAMIRIIDGAGDGQYRTIVSNTPTQFTVTPDWDVTPTTTSKYIVYSSDDWPAAAGTPGLGWVQNRPIVVENIAYFPQGQSVNMRRMRVNASSHDFADDGTNRANLMYFNIEGATPQIYAANTAASNIKAANPVAWGVNLTLGAAKSVGGSEYRITNLHSFGKVLRIFKEDGIYTYNNGVIEKDGQAFSDVPDPSTGLAVATHNGALWWGWAHDVIKQIGSSYDPMLNYKKGYDGVLEARKGYISCIVSAVGWLFFVIDGGTSNFSSIICWNGMGWHEVFRGWEAGTRIRNAAWQPCFGARGRLWFDAGGDLVYMEFPLLAANPLRDTTLNYYHEAICVSPTYDAHDQNLYKIIGLLRVFLDSGTCEIDYQTNANVGTTNWTELSTASTNPVSDVDVNLGGVFQIRFRFRLQVSNSQTPAVISGWQITGRMMELDRYQYLCTFRADSDAETKADEPDFDPNALFDQLLTWAQRQTKLVLHSTIKSVDNNTAGRVVTVALPTKVVDSLDTEENKWTGTISCAILEV